MDTTRIHRASAWTLIGLSVTALLTVLSGFLQAPQPDEGTGAHVFQLAIVALLPIGLVFLGTADWRRPARVARELAAPAVVTALAFAVLFYLEHVFWAGPR